MAGQWRGARPTHGKLLFSTNNDKASCAAYAQSWLVLSLIGGAPLKTAGSIAQNPGMMDQIQRGEGVGPGKYARRGGPSVTALPESGLQIADGYPKTPAGTAWGIVFDNFCREPEGFYYLTMKNPNHSMACHIGTNYVHYLEPQEGLWLIAKGSFGTWGQSRYGDRQRLHFPGRDYKIYRVRPEA